MQHIIRRFSSVLFLTISGLLTGCGGEGSFFPEPGTYSETQFVTINHTVAADIYYTLDGSTPTFSSARYTGPITISETTMINALPTLEGQAGEVFSGAYVIEAGTIPEPEPEPEPEPGWKLVWQDEFDGDRIDLSKWEHADNGKGGGNNELQYYTARSDNSYVANGRLVIKANRERYTGSDGTREYTSARLSTPNKADFLYGKVDVRAKLPAGQGLWPAAWMLPTDYTYGGWAASGEIDILEAVNLEVNGSNTVHGTIHYGGPWPDNTSTGTSYVPGTSVVDNFHTYSIEWEPNEIRWYVDGQLYQTQNSWWSSAANYPAPFNQRFHLILNVAVGGNWPGSPDSSTQFPQTMEVDYVRVYEWSDDGAGDGGAGSGNSGNNDLEGVLIPAKIEAENYDNYYDTTSGNEGGAYRNDNVDIETTSDVGGGYNVGWTDSGEYLRYNIANTEAKEFRITARVATIKDNRSMQLKLNGVDIGNTLYVPNTGGWQSWRETSTLAYIPAGEHHLEVYFNGNEINLNHLNITAADDYSGAPNTVNKARGEWTLVVVPDTQHYSQNRSNAPIAHMRTAFDWIVQTKDDLNIKFVQGLGDITEGWNNRWEWDNSTSAWDKLYGQVPFMPIIGNHDDPWTMNEYFPVRSFSGESWWGGDFGGIENNYALMTIGKEDYMFLQVETYDQYSEYRPAGINWVKQVLANHPNRKVILATHDTWATDHIKNNLLYQYDNIVMSNAGHVCQREAYYTTRGPRGGISNNFVTDYQCDAQEVMLLRYYVFKPMEDRVDYYTYSPVTQQFEEDASSQGSFTLIQQDP
ncbi:family 16 glycosylhydrolase [Bacterioplanoides sp.]|uniref:family 16 glycosylhydrolase n=1 Tax=Bacterioplanoides sp. TaxID=2066072 RepID=UPI003B00DD73